MRLCVLVLLAMVACAKHGDDEAKGREATAAMKQFTDASYDMSTWFPRELAKLEGKLVFDAAGAATELATDVLPKLDAYLATAEHAVGAADVYIATGVALDDATRKQIERMRKANGVFRELRDKLAEIQQTLARGNVTPAELDKVSSALVAIGVKLALIL